MERTNFRYLTPEDFDELADGSVMDVSFISILKLIPEIYKLTKDDSLGVWLIKPQFEIEKEKLGKHGVVREAELHEEVLHKTIEGIIKEGYTILDLDYSPIRGPKGNIEFLCFTQKGLHENGIYDFNKKIEEVVKNAHQLGKGEHA